MSFFKKLWNGAKNVVKGIGKQVKKAVKSVGKFVNKLGLVGQIGMMFILPGVGGMLGNMIGRGVGALAASTNPILAGVGKILSTAGKFAHTAGNAFKTVTDGITSFVANISKGVVNQTANFLGKDVVFKTGPVNIADGFKTWMQGVADDVSNITSPFRDISNSVTTKIDSNFDKTFSPPSEEFVTRVPTPRNTMEFDPDFELRFAPEVGEFNMPEIGRDTITKLADAEKSALRRFMENTFEYAKSSMSQVPNRMIDRASDTVTEGVVTRGAQALGLVDEPNYTVQNITNPIPQFNSTPISHQYESAGIGYGALPDNRIQFFAAQQTPYTDFGMGGFNQFSQFRSY